MTIASEVNRISYQGNGTTGPFVIPFYFLEDNDLLVIKTLRAAPFTETILVQTTDYTLTGAANPLGGSLTLIAALAATYNISIIRDPDSLQGLDLTPNDRFPADSLERALDKLAMRDQRFLDLMSRAAVLSDGDTSGFDPTMPAPVANASLKVNAAKTGFEWGLAAVLSDGDTSGFDPTIPTPVANAFLKANAAKTGFEWGLAAGVLAVSAFGQTLLNAVNAAAARVLFTPLTTKGDLWGFAAADTRVAVGADGKALVADSSQAAGLVYIDNPSRPNLLINPNWQIDQINEGALYTINAGAVQGPDGWTGGSVGAGVFKLRTIADPDNAALKCLEITCTTADAAIAAGDLYFLQTAIEGYDAAALMAGTASAQQITIQFKFKSNVNGVYGISIQNGAANRSYVGTINVVDANEHEYTVTLTLDTAGVWLYTNGKGLVLQLTLAGGATFQTAAGAWAAGNFYTTAAQCNFMSNVANVAYLKRIQLIPGSLVQAYKPADIQKELAKCQRYYFKTYSVGVVPGTVSAVGAMFWGDAGVAAVNNGIHLLYTNIHFPATMRAVPTMTGYSPDTGTINTFRDFANAADTVATFSNPGEKLSAMSAASTANTQAPYFRAHVVANARLS